MIRGSKNILKPLSSVRKFSGNSPQFFLNKSPQFDQSLLLDNGDIELGEIPEALKYDREYQLTTISNGMKVMSEPSTSEVAAVGVFINAGSRHEKIENTGEAHFLEHLHFKGSKTRSRYGLETEVENRGH
tara:strand:+ start:28 stop:417 length:390 start_codon:yes stop_codon:yes gene_type:complete